MTRHTGPLPPYSRKTHIAGWPDAFITEPMLAIADYNQIKALPQWLWWRAISEAAAGRRCPLPPLGTFYPRTYQPRPYVDPRTGWTLDLPLRHYYAFRPSKRFRAAVSGVGHYDSDDYPAILKDAADLAKCPYNVACSLWTMMAAAIVKAVAKGDKVAFRGFGSFIARKRSTRRYRHWRTGELKWSAATTLPALTHSRALKKWLDAGEIPLPVDP